MRKIGLHIRLTTTFEDVANRAIAFKIPIFQCFFIQQVTNQFIQPDQDQITAFLKKRTHFKQLFVHGSYWINLASLTSGNKIITREIELAKKLEFTHIVVHPGSARARKDKREGISIIAKNLNMILKKEDAITIVLENTAHAGLSIGGDLHDFKFLKERLDHPEKVLFCLDTAHAFSYGYDIQSAAGQESFFELVEQTMGFEAIALIHLNDTHQQKGSRIDRHELIGAGLLGDSLKSFIAHPKLTSVPIIMELPIVDETQEQKILEKVRSWE